MLIKVLHVSLNYRDLGSSPINECFNSNTTVEVIQGLYTHHRSVSSTKSLVPCSDMHGKIVGLGSDVKNWKIGDKVLSIGKQSHLHGQLLESDMATGLGLPLDGVLSQYIVLNAESLVAPPKHLGSPERSTLTVAGVTAYTSLFGLQKLLPGQTVLVQGTGGVSMQALLLAKAIGAKVILTSSSDDKLARGRALGADHLINYKKMPNWQDEVMDITAGLGADHIIENGGKDTLSKSLSCVAFGGQISLIGYLSGKEPPAKGEHGITVMAIKRNCTLKGLLNGSRDMFVELVEMCEEHAIVPVVDRVFAWDEFRKALEYMWNGSHFGKVVIEVGRD